MKFLVPLFFKKVYSHYEVTKMDLLVKNSQQLKTINYFRKKRSIIDTRYGSKYTSVTLMVQRFFTKEIFSKCEQQITSQQDKSAKKGPESYLIDLPIPVLSDYRNLRQLLLYKFAAGCSWNQYQFLVIKNEKVYIFFIHGC